MTLAHSLAEKRTLQTSSNSHATAGICALKKMFIQQRGISIAIFFTPIGICCYTYIADVTWVKSLLNVEYSFRFMTFVYFERIYQRIRLIRIVKNLLAIQRRLLHIWWVASGIRQDSLKDNKNRHLRDYFVTHCIYLLFISKSLQGQIAKHIKIVFQIEVLL